MFRLKLNIDKIEVMLTNGTDRISIHLEDCKTPFPYMKGQKAVFNMECAQNYGVQYVKENFGYKPSIINTRTKRQ